MNKTDKPKFGSILTDDQISQQMISIGARLRGIRKSRGISTDDVSRDLGIAKAQLSKDENGLLNITLARLIKYAAYYNCDILPKVNTKVNIKYVSLARN